MIASGMRGAFDCRKHTVNAVIAIVPTVGFRQGMYHGEGNRPRRLEHALRVGLCASSHCIVHVVIHSTRGIRNQNHS